MYTVHYKSHFPLLLTTITMPNFVKIRLGPGKSVDRGLPTFITFYKVLPSDMKIFLEGKKKSIFRKFCSHSK